MFCRAAFAVAWLTARPARNASPLQRESPQLETGRDSGSFRHPEGRWTAEARSVYRGADHLDPRKQDAGIQSAVAALQGRLVQYSLPAPKGPSRPRDACSRRTGCCNPYVRIRPVGLPELSLQKLTEMLRLLPPHSTPTNQPSRR